MELLLSIHLLYPKRGDISPMIKLGNCSLATQSTMAMGLNTALDNIWEIESTCRVQTTIGTSAWSNVNQKAKGIYNTLKMGPLIIQDVFCI